MLHLLCESTTLKNASFTDKSEIIGKCFITFVTY